MPTMITVDAGMVAIAAAIVYLAHQIGRLSINVSNHYAPETIPDAEKDPGKEIGRYDDGLTQEGPAWTYWELGEDPVDMSAQATAAARRIL